jgi:peptide/nickel transport system ATP-binding protein
MTSASPDLSASPPLLSVKNLSVVFNLPDRVIKAVDSLSFTINKGETVAIAGESGCGKSVTAFSIMRLLARPGEITGGEIIFNGTNLLNVSENEMRKLRGNSISMVFQEPMTSLNPVLKVGFQVVEGLLLHRTRDSRLAEKEAVQLLSMVGIPQPGDRFHSYPHQLSGGMKQRVMIAMALACRPELLIADEPTTALDVTVQAEILELIDRMKSELGMSLLLITHNLGIVEQRADRIVIMYAGRALETGPTPLVMKSPLHPYTKGLLASLPQNSLPGSRLPTISGSLPATSREECGCCFVDRCSMSEAACNNPQQLRDMGQGHYVACWRGR